MSNGAMTRLIAASRDVFGARWQPGRLATAPGRVELLGNHVDYNGGLVLAGAIDRRITALAGPSEDTGSLVLHAPDVTPDPAEVRVSAPTIDKPNGATTPRDYLAGIVQALQEARIPVRGGQHIAVAGNVPVGFGMSSSAALCVSLSMLVADRQLEPSAIVEIARRAEHLTGAPVGAMDQSASVAGGVILFNGANGHIERLAPELGEHVFAIANSGVHHALSDSRYPERVRESERALELLRSIFNVNAESLGRMSPDEWEALTVRGISDVPDPLRKRIQHVVSEVQRVREGVDAVASADWQRFGELMTASGRSSATDYEISHPVVEELVEMLLEQPGVLGARMMGGGEGGPALALLRRDAVDQVRQTLAERFFDPRGMYPSESFEVCTFGPGAHAGPLADLP